MSIHVIVGMMQGVVGTLTVKTGNVSINGIVGMLIVKIGNITVQIVVGMLAVKTGNMSKEGTHSTLTDEARSCHT